MARDKIALEDLSSVKETPNASVTASVASAEVKPSEPVLPKIDAQGRSYEPESARMPLLVFGLNRGKGRFL